MGCNHDCSSCSQSCGGEQDLHEPLNQYSTVKHVIGVVSGKGGVGKSMVTSQLAVAMNRRGFKTAILDADITGPSIPKAFGVHEKAKGSDLGILPAITETGIELMSINLLLKEETDPVVWRSPMIVGTLKQFWTDVLWNDVDYMFVDMPPGTGDIPLTVFQSLPLDGIIVVASPQELVSMIVEKAVKMAEMMNVPLLGLVENMSYFVCPDCGKKHSVFGDSHIDEIAANHDTRVLAKLPIDPDLAAKTDAGQAEAYEGDYLSEAAAFLQTL
ncbi:Mrp/NBP35 family ATP-binding protein [Lachnoclostridium sp. MSJ-17]|uniref:Mrp/NBP35 family ATP-binding protein n=1 Tax=Lachnoclostridium sp. MSJ-17 TaxID=2841516 RepID=UPI001C1221E4|nr:Mrp/NBP35 family ATP-binding protein [Lachnoclostridium sp. MSJ-17]MBU5462833.1 Mrp/NBP35 family ATP-binding protein [Lachnoclostridium sp. MSJ-17]